MWERGGRPGQGRGGERGPGLLCPLSAWESGGHRRVKAGAIQRPVAGQDGGREGLLGEHRVHQGGPRLQGRSVAGAVRPGGNHSGRDRWRGRCVPGGQRRSGLRGQGRGLPGGECGARARGERSLRQVDNNLLRLPTLLCPRPLPGARGDGGAGWRLLEHRSWRPEARTDQRGHVLPAPAPHHQRFGVILSPEIFGSNSWRLQNKTGPSSLTISSLDRVRVSWFNLYRAGPEIVTYLKGKPNNDEFIK